MKIIHILGRPHTVRLPPLGEVHRIDTVNRRYALKTRQYSDKYQIECWWPEKQISRPITAVEDGVTFRIFPASSVKFPYKCISLSLVRALRKECSENQVLVFLHSFGGQWTTLLPLYIKGVPFVTQQYNAGVSYKWKKLIRHPWLLPLSAMERWAYAQIDHFFLLYHETEEELAKYVNPNNISINTFGVDFGLFKPMEKNKAREELKLHPNKHYVLYVGCIEPRKGLDYLLEALPSIVKRFPETVLLVVGRASRPKFFNRLQEMIMSLGIQDIVRFLGEVRNDKLPVYYNAADLLVLPSFSEGIPFVLMEASACECPFVATPVGGIPEFFRNVPYGKLIPPANPGAIAEAVIDVLKDPSQFKGSREKAWRIYSWDSIMARIFKVFEGLRQRYFSN